MKRGFLTFPFGLNLFVSMGLTKKPFTYIALCSKNVYFAMTLRGMMGFTRLFIQTLVDLNDDIHDDTSHVAVFDAIASHNAQEAYEQMFIHVVELKKSMCELEDRFREVTNTNLRA